MKRSPAAVWYRQDLISNARRVGALEARLRLREERAHGPAQQDDIISSLNRPRERRLVAIEPAQDALEESRRAALDERGGFIVAVELEERRKKRQDEGKRDLGSANSKSVSHAQPDTHPGGERARIRDRAAER